MPKSEKNLEGEHKRSGSGCLFLSFCFLSPLVSMGICVWAATQKPLTAPQGLGLSPETGCKEQRELEWVQRKRRFIWYIWTAKDKDRYRRSDEVEWDPQRNVKSRQCFSSNKIWGHKYLFKTSSIKCTLSSHHRLFQDTLRALDITRSSSVSIQKLDCRQVPAPVLGSLVSCSQSPLEQETELQGKTRQGIASGT